MDFYEAYWGSLELTGESFNELIMNSSGQLIGIIPIRSDLMAIVPTTHGSIAGYVQEVNGKMIPFEEEEIWLSKYWNPLSDIRGLSPLMAATQTIVTELKAISYNKSKLDEDVTPTGIFSAKGEVAEDEYDKIVQAFKDTYTGASNAGKTLFLDHDTSYTNIAISQKDMEYIQQRKLAKHEIREAFGVPPILTQDLSDSSILQNTDVQIRGFWEHNLVPKLLKDALRVNMQIVPLMTNDPTVFAAYDFSNVKALQKSEADRLEHQAAKFKLGALTPNEIREADGKEGYEGGDKYYVPANLIPVNQEGEEPTEAQQNSFNRLGIWYKGFPQKRADEIFKKLISVLESEMQSMEVNVNKYFKRGEGRINGAVQAITFKGIKADLIDEVHFNPADPSQLESWVDDIVSAIVGNQGEEGEAFRELTSANMRSFVKMAGEDLIRLLGGDGTLDLFEPSIARIMAERMVTTSNSVWNTSVKQLKKKVASAIEKAIQQGLSVNATKDLVIEEMKLYYQNITKQRAALIARTEGQAMGNIGRMEGMKQEGFARHTWVTSGDTKVRPGHEDANRQTVRIGQEFPVGKSGGYNGDKSFPSDVNERCFTIPTTADITFGV